MAVIQVPPERDGQYIVFTFDSFQAEMDRTMRSHLSLIIWEAAHSDNEKPTSAMYDNADVREFMKSHVKFQRVEVCKATTLTTEIW